MAGFFFPPLMRPWLYGLALMHCNIVKHPQNRWMWYVNYVSRESQFPDRRVVFDCDPFFIIMFRDRSTNQSSVVMWTLICLQSSDSLIFTHFFFFLLFFCLPICQYLPTSWPAHWLLHNIDSLNWKNAASLIFFLSIARLSAWPLPKVVTPDLLHLVCF